MKTLLLGIVFVAVAVGLPAAIIWHNNNQATGTTTEDEEIFADAPGFTETPNV